MTASIRCALGWHAEAVRDVDHGGRRVLRCPRCWRVRGYVETDAAKVAAMRAGQRAQALAIARKRIWRRAIEGGRTTPL